MFDVNPKIKIGPGLLTEIYTDLAKPTAQNAGKTFGGLTKLFAVAFGTTSEILANKLEKKLQSFVLEAEKRIEEIPVDQRTEPSIATGMKLSSNLPKVLGEPLLEDIFLNLLLSTMDKRAAEDYFPSFPEIVASLSPDEAKILKFLGSHQENSVFAMLSIYSRLPNGSQTLAYRNVSMLGQDADCEFPKNSPAYLDNLSRLGLVDLNEEMVVGVESEYSRIMEKFVLVNLSDDNPGPEGYDPKHFDLIKGFIRLSSMGVSFCRACKIFGATGKDSPSVASTIAYKPLVLRG